MSCESLHKSSTACSLRQSFEDRVSAMKTPTLFLLCVTLALAGASPLFSRPRAQGYYDSDGYYHMAARKTMLTTLAEAAQVKTREVATEGGICVSLSQEFDHDDILHQLHICPSDGDRTEHCYLAVQPLRRCCDVFPRDAIPLYNATYKLNNHDSVPVEFHRLRIGSIGTCFRIEQDDIDSCCPRNPGCETVGCPANIHPNETCIEGYQPPDCCECLPRYFRDPETQRCTPVCPNCIGEVNETGCTECRPGYLLPTCCRCAPEYYRTDQDTCEPLSCPAGLTSRSVCTSDRVCSSCEDGYATPPHCCYCANGTDLTTCDSSGRNCDCRTGFTGPGCCECAPGYYRTPGGNCELLSCPAGLTSRSVCTSDRVCDSCENGYATPPHCCYCANGTDLDSCDSSGRNCDCRTGFTGPGCCECAPGYYRTPGGNCEPLSCPAGLTSRSVCTSDRVCNSCEDGYATPPHCCYCANGTNADFCSDNGRNCMCRTGFAGPGCCECATGYYGTPEENCELPSCPAELTSRSVCTNGECNSCENGYTTPPHCCYCANGTDLTTCDSSGRNCDCRTGFGGPGCCDDRCEANERHIYFAIDVGDAHRIDTQYYVHCQLTQLMRLMINVMNTTKFEAVLFPNAPDTSTSNPAIPLFKTNSTCEESVGKLISMSDAVFSYQVYLRNNGDRPDPFTQYYNRDRHRPETNRLSNKRYPAKALDGIRQDINKEINEMPQKDLSRVVVLFVTGNIEEWGERADLELMNKRDLLYQRNTTRAVEDLVAANIPVVVAVNRPNQQQGDQTDQTAKLVREIQAIDSRLVQVVDFEDTGVLQIELIERLRDVIRIICPDEASEILDNLRNPKPDLKIQCVNGRNSGCLSRNRGNPRVRSGTTPNPDYRKYTTRRPVDLCIPQEIRCQHDTADSVAEWDILSPLYNGWHNSRYPDYEEEVRPPGPPGVNTGGNLEDEIIAAMDNKRGKLEEEILAAVEEVLEKRLG